MSANMTARIAPLVALSGFVATLLSGQTVGAAPAARPAVTVRFGVIAEEPNEPDRMFNVYAPLLGLLRRRLAPAGIDVGELVIARHLDDLAQRIKRRQVDFVLESVFPTLSLRERSRSLDPGLLVVRRGEREYRSVFFTRQESPIRTLRDLRGRTLVLQAIRSTSAFALPRAELARAGIGLVPADDLAADPKSVRYVLALAEVNQAVWVLHEKGDAGAFNEGDWAALPDKVRARLRIFARSRPIHRGLIAFRTGLDATTRHTVEQALLGLHEDEAGRAVLMQASITRLERMTPTERRTLLDWVPVLLPSRQR
jgi:phosphonate transport system substrate-binding protein